MDIFSIIPKKLKSAAVLVVFVWVAFGFMDSYIREDEPRAIRVQQALEREFSIIKPLPQTVYCDYHAGHKGNLAGVGGVLSTNLPFQEVRDYFDQELKRNGWQYYGEERVVGGWSDFGGKSIHYCKGEYNASLQYAGENAGYGWNYGLSLSWRLDSKNNKSNNITCHSDSGQP